MKYILKVIILSFFIVSSVISVSFSSLEDEELSNLSLYDLEERLHITYEPMSLLESLLYESQSTFLGEPENNCEKRDDYKIPQFFTFMPAFKGKVSKVGDSITFGNFCFKKNTLTVTSIENGKIELNLEAYEPKSFACNDVYLFHTSSIFHIKTTIVRGNHKVKITVTPDQLNEIAVGGLRLFSLCDGFLSTAKSLYKTIKLLLSDYPQSNKEFVSLFGKEDKSVEEQEQEHMDFLKVYAGFNITKRGKYENIVLPLEDQIQSGDFLGLSQVINGESCLIQFITGGRISHSAMALKIDGKLHVVESENRGIFIRTYEDFIKDQVETYHSVAWFPLSKESRAKFNEEAAVKWIKEREGMPYGMKNFVVAAIDTTKDNLPVFMDNEHLLLIIGIIEKIKAPLAMTFLGYTMNMRLGTTNLTSSELAVEMSKRGLVFEDVMTIPERDDWLYHDGENWVCSALVVGLYKVAGLLDDMDIQAHEFTPKDIYMMNIFDKDSKNNRPDICKEADPELEYCQIMGKFRISAKGYNTINLYPHMNEKCPSLPPLYVRTEGC